MRVLNEGIDVEVECTPKMQEIVDLLAQEEKAVDGSNR
jgi:hypothetical protein